VIGPFAHPCSCFLQEAVTQARRLPILQKVDPNISAVRPRSSACYRRILSSPIQPVKQVTRMQPRPLRLHYNPGRLIRRRAQDEGLSFASR
jgi:hypothetical protein